MKALLTTLLLTLTFLLNLQAQMDTVHKKGFVAEIFYQMNPNHVDGFSLNKNASYVFETGANISVKSHKVLNHNGNLFICVAFKKSNSNYEYVNEIYSSSYFNFGMRYSIYFRLSPSFSLILSDELMLNFQIQTMESNPDNGYCIDDTDKALQNKLGLMFFWDFSEFCSIGFGPKIAPCLRLSPRKYGSVSNSNYYVSILDEGWPFYFGSTIRIRL
ncbi:MAG: hypothetical protein JXR53_03540 [Bacteroidales bacterium]|nr:hypothetical protein [Bacteroidales bacterium]